MFVALDANYLRSGLQPPELEALRARGFQLAIGCFALSELWVRALETKSVGLMIAAVRRLQPFLHPQHPVVPAGRSLHQLLRAGDTKRGRRLRDAFPRRTGELFAYIAAGERVREDAWREAGLQMRCDLDVNASAYRQAIAEAHAFGATLPPEVREVPLTDHLEHHRRELVASFKLESIAARLDAYLRVFALEVTHAMLNSSDRPAPTDNDAEDLVALQYIAGPAYFATRDKRLTRRVDESGSYQAPWVRTLGELLVDDLPRGKPWGPSAQKQAASFRRRSEKERADLEVDIFGRLRSAGRR